MVINTCWSSCKFQLANTQSNSYIFTGVRFCEVYSLQTPCFQFKIFSEEMHGETSVGFCCTTWSKVCCTCIVLNLTQFRLNSFPSFVVHLWNGGLRKIVLRWNSIPWVEFLIIATKPFLLLTVFIGIISYDKKIAMASIFVALWWFLIMGHNRKTLLNWSLFSIYC